MPPDIIDVSLPSCNAQMVDHVLTNQPDEDAPASPSLGHSGPHTPDEIPFVPITGPFAGHPEAQAGAPAGSVPGPSSGSGGMSPTSPSTPTLPQGGDMPPSPGGMGIGSSMPWRRGHSRKQSLGTTHSSSPSNRRRSLGNTMDLIRDVVDGRDANADGQMRSLAEIISSPSKSKPDGGLA